MGTISYDGATGITVVYSSLVENTVNANGDQSYRNVYYMSSQDGGTTWSTPVRFDSDDFSEQVFPSSSYDMSISGSNHIAHVIYHVDEEPGTQMGTDADLPTVNTVTYNNVSFTVGLNEANAIGFTVGVQPNPASTTTNLVFTTLSSQNVNIEISNIYGQVVKSMNVDMTSGENVLPLNVKQFAAGVYTVNFITGKQTATAKFVVK
ncbi:MAG: T9SS type A sorting domain-containing protein [Bacteroidetes bacterium]|nr:T9SS type A sorting domain-containing protein [Bacteroidota bacterium]